MLIAGIFGVLAVRRRELRRHYLTTSVLVFVLGLSDIVEIQSGAWWRPWWLLVWKAACLTLFAVLWRSWPRGTSGPNSESQIPGGRSSATRRR